MAAVRGSTATRRRSATGRAGRIVGAGRSAGWVTALVILAACGGGAELYDDRSFTVCDEQTHVFDAAIGDLTGDGRDEIVVVCAPRSGGWDPGHLEVYAADAADPRMIWQHGFDLPPRAAAIGDLDGDGSADLVVVVDGPHERTLVFARGDGTGDLVIAAEHVTTGELGRVTTFDWTGDGALDVLMPEGNAVLVNEAIPGNLGPFSFERIAPPEEIHQVARADIDGDGAPDTVHLDLIDSSVRVYPNGSAETVTYPVVSDVAAIASVHAAADFDGDGIVELVVTSEPEPLMAEVHLLDSADGQNWALMPPIDGLSGPMPEQILVADFTGDGALDLMIVPIADPDVDEYALTLAAGDGSGGFAAPETIPVDGFPYRAVSAGTTGPASVELIFVAMENENNRLIRWVFTS